MHRTVSGLRQKLCRETRLTVGCQLCMRNMQAATHHLLSLRPAQEPSPMQSQEVSRSRIWFLVLSPEFGLMYLCSSAPMDMVYPTP